MRFASRLAMLLTFAASAIAGLILFWPSADDPSPGDHYVREGAEEQIQIDQVGPAVELRIHYDTQNVRIDDGKSEHEATNTQLFGDIGQLPDVEIDPTRTYVSFLEVVSDRAGTPVDTIAHLSPQDDFLATYVRAEEG